MKAKLGSIWEDIRTSFWFIPGLLAIGSIALSFVMIEVDKAMGSEQFTELRWVMEAGPDGVRAVLQVIAGSMITVAGTVFSITIIALSLASQQFGPRILRNFMRDRGNQFVLGTFTATFLYCILILRTVSSEEPRFVPHASVLVAVILATAGVGVLIYFIHHVAVAIQAPYIIAGVARELEDQIDRLFPETLGMPPPAEPALPPGLPPDFEERSGLISCQKSGYLQSIDEAAIMAAAQELDLIVRIRLRPGGFVVSGEPCIQAWPRDRITEDAADRLRRTFLLGRARTAEQDVSFTIDQLVEVAARSLSPSLNDPFTAISCIDRLGDAFVRLASRRTPSAYRYDEHQQLRVIAEPFRLVELVIQSIEPIRQYGSTHALIALRLLDTLAIVGPFVQRDEDRQILLREIQRTRESAERGHAGDPQRRYIASRAERASAAVMRGQTPEKHASGNPMH